MVGIIIINVENLSLCMAKLWLFLLFVEGRFFYFIQLKANFRDFNGHTRDSPLNVRKIILMEHLLKGLTFYKSTFLYVENKKKRKCFYEECRKNSKFIRIN